MKFFKTVIILFLFSTAFSALVYYLNPDTITATPVDIAGEIVVVAIPIFLLVLFVYVVIKVISKSAKKSNKKSLPKQEGPNNA